MTLFLDTANIEEIREWMKTNTIRGVTTNQKIILNSGLEYSHNKYVETIQQICSLVDGPVSVELTKTLGSVDELVEEAKLLHEIDSWVNVKVPMWGDGKGLEVISALNKLDIPTNATCMMTSIQGVLAAEAGATFVSLFYNRSMEYFHDHLSKEIHITSRNYARTQLKELRTYINDNGLKTKIIAGSMRLPSDIMECLISGAHIVTVPYKIMKKLPFNERTEETMKEFDDAWKELTKQ